MPLPNRYCLDVRGGTSAGRTHGPLPPGLRISGYREGVDAAGIERLVAACRAASDQEGPAFRSDGIRAELAGRPGREARGWLAWPTAEWLPAGDAATDTTCPLGLLTAVIRPAADGPRFSIAWLLVHPRARRRGVGTALVATAIAAASDLGAGEVTAETSPNWPAAEAFWRSLAGG
jgi:GNAT superfamily N-acetyltransferase